MSETRYPPWLCHKCGYMMDAASHMREPVTPKEHDLSLCLNCGALYVLHSERWTPITPAERDGLDPELKRELTEMEIARQLTIDRDLSKRGGRV